MTKTLVYPLQHRVPVPRGQLLSVWRRSTSSGCSRREGLIHAHIALTVIALLLERMAEHACSDTWRNIRDDLKGIQLAQLIGSNGTLW